MKTPQFLIHIYRSNELESQMTSMEKSKEDELYEALEQMAQLNSNLENSQRKKHKANRSACT